MFFLHDLWLSLSSYTCCLMYLMIFQTSLIVFVDHGISRRFIPVRLIIEIVISESKDIILKALDFPVLMVSSPTTRSWWNTWMAHDAKEIREVDGKHIRLTHISHFGRQWIFKCICDFIYFQKCSIDIYIYTYNIYIYIHKTAVYKSSIV